jgi:hypothetical protein
MRGHPSVPFLTAAIAALVLYRGMTSVLGLGNEAIFTVGLIGAAALTAAWLLAYFVLQPRKE